MTRLTELREEVIDVLQEELSVMGAGHPVREIAGAFERASGLFQALGACNLLLSADTERFRVNLVYSGFARRYFLRRLHAEPGAETEHAALSRTEAFFDAWTAGHEPLAAEIVRMGPERWTPEGEYEDDYLYHALLQHAALDPARTDPARPAAWLARFEAVLDGADAPRLGVCRALIDGDARGFEDAFKALLYEHAVWAEENRPHLQHDPVFLLRARLYVEGLAVLRIAERAGLADPAREYAFCPVLARLPAAPEWPDDLFDDVERVAADHRRQRALAP